MNKIRTQIQLDPADHARVKDYARGHGLSLAGAIRALVRKGLGDGPDAASGWDAFLELKGRFSDPSPGAPVAREHDKFLHQ